jgi:hypothetical protein
MNEYWVTIITQSAYLAVTLLATCYWWWAPRAGRQLLPFGYGTLTLVIAGGLVHTLIAGHPVPTPEPVMWVARFAIVFVFLGHIWREQARIVSTRVVKQIAEQVIEDVTEHVHRVENGH